MNVWRVSKRETFLTACRKITGAAVFCAAALLLSGCASQIDAGISQQASAPGFWWGLWHGFIFPWAWIGSLFSDDIAVYGVPTVVAGTISGSFWG
ncbi:hypothetical protein CP97_05735 [Aurantiacibacter atlanticus]|uniref:Lipoprotein n=1 Tax=Aurantiacibacter atlanticus TaxID=1648404 RepID=A0A0H4VAJ7_9SPHN|nr:hypothetical protein CP97_05735 [Aurantiacibacter atlanticus]